MHPLWLLVAVFQGAARQLPAHSHFHLSTVFPLARPLLDDVTYAPMRQLVQALEA